MKPFFLLLLLASCFTMGCAGLSKELELNSVQSDALVFGYVDMGKAPCELDWFEFKQLIPATDKPFWNFRIDKGCFYRENFAPGSYQLTKFGGQGKGFLIFSSNTYYSFDLPIQESGFRIPQAGRLYYLGSFKLTSKGDFFSSTYSVEPVAHPTELEVLQKMLPNAKGNQWEPLIERRIQALSR